MTSAENGADPGLVRLVGVYDANSTVRGELAYWVGARLGRRHCSLCDITHGAVRAKPEWVALRAGLPVPFDTYHRDDVPSLVRQVAGDTYPIVIAETTTGHVPLLGPSALDACRGSIDALVTAIETAVVALGFVWPA